jgi:iodotyrosine deiodinase
MSIPMVQEQAMSNAEHPHHPACQPVLYDHHWLTGDAQAAAAGRFLETMACGRTIRDFATTPVPFALIEQAIRAAALASSGANQQP